MPHVADNTTLLLKSTLDYPNGVWRDDYAAGNGAPPQFFRPANTACTLNAGNGDGGMQVKSSNNKCWTAAEVANIDTEQFGMATTASAAANLAACKAAANAASVRGLPLIFGGGLVPINPGCDIYAFARVQFKSGTWLVAEQDGPVLGTRNSQGAGIGLTNGDDITFEQLQVDMNNHQGAALLNRAGMHLTVRGFRYLHPRAGSFTDIVGVTDAGTTTNGMTSVTGLSSLVGRVGMVVSDSRGCIPAGDQVAANDDGGNALTLDVAAATGCGANDTLTFYAKFPSAGIIDSGYYNANGAYYAHSYNPDVRVTADTSVAAYSGGNTFSVADPTGIIKMSARTITNAIWNSGFGTVTYTVSSPTNIAAGQLVCAQGVSPAGYNQCGIAARGTVGSTVVISGVIVDPGAYSSGGALYFGGSFVADTTDLTRMPNGSFVYDISGSSVTVANVSAAPMPGGLSVGDQVSFTTGGIGLLFIGTGDHDNPNGSLAEGGKMMGFHVGQLNYQGNNIHTREADYSLNCYGNVFGGNGRGRSSPATALQDTDESSWYEYQMCGTAVWMTPDSTKSCAGGCTGKPIASSSSSAGDDTTLEILDQGANNNAQLGPLTYTNHATYIPTIACGSGAVAGYTSPRFGDYSVIDGWAKVTIEIQAAGTGTCSGAARVTLPLTFINGARQICSGVDFTSGMALPAWATQDGAVNFGGSPTITDRLLIHCEFYTR